jgi:glyoxylase-like metal-dependent hydrolase (beta-lactamase superfamily II)
MEIGPGIHHVNGVRGANCYLAISGGTILIVDTGMPGNGEKILKYLKGLGRDPAEVGYIVLTHSDIDHCGSAFELKKVTGAKVAIHEDDARSLSGEDKLKEVKGIISPLFKMMTKFIRFHPVKPDLLLSEGDEIGGFRVIYTPGHTRGSVCLHRPGEVLFAGDALRSDKRGNPQPPSKLMSVDMKQAWESVRKIAELEFNILLPGHGSPVLQNASKAVRHLLANIS